MTATMPLPGLKTPLKLADCEVGWLKDNDWWEPFHLYQDRSQEDHHNKMRALAYEDALREAVLKKLLEKSSEVSHVEVMYLFPGPKIFGTVFKFDGGRNKRCSGHPNKFKSTLHFWQKTAEVLHVGPWEKKS